MYAVIFIPDFALQSVLRPEPDLRSKAVGLVDSESSKPAIIELTGAAKKAGVVPGLTASQAMARCGDLIVKTRSIGQETAATEILLQTAYAFSPNIEDTAPGICTMELKGLGLENGREWSEKIIHVLRGLYLEARIGFGPTPGLALLDARLALTLTLSHPMGEGESVDRFVWNGTIGICCEILGISKKQSIAVPSPIGWERVRVRAEALPLSALDPSPELLEILNRWGIRTVGEFLALDKNDVAERLGPPALALFERLSPDAARPLKLITPPEHFSEQIDFEHEIETTEPLLFVLRRFVEQLSRRLELIYLVVAEFQLRLGLADGTPYERTFKVPSPTGNIDLLFRMLQTHLETVRTASPIISLQLMASPARPETHQFGLFENTLRNPNQFAETLARLTALVGSENVGTPSPEQTHRPDAFRMTRPDFDSARTSNFELQTSGGCLRRFRPPLPAHVEFRSDKPALIRSDVYNGAIADRRGPFFSSGNWWDQTRWAREEWDIETVDGSLFRIFRSNDGCFVEGVYD